MDNCTDTESKVKIDEELYNAFKDVYKNLKENQKELDDDFKSVLYNNLWDLYE